jgi:hypothetical protein
MQVPLRISFRGVARSSALEERVRELVQHLERVGHRILSADVTVERVGLRHRHGPLYDVRVQLTLPGARVEVTRHPRHALVHDPYVAVRGAFDTAGRRLEELVRVRRAEVKSHRNGGEVRWAALRAAAASAAEADVEALAAAADEARRGALEPSLEVRSKPA